MSLLLIPAYGLAATHIVPDHQPSIAQAIAAAADGDSILLRAGVYHEHSLVIAKSLCIRGETGSQSGVTIDADSEGRVFTAESGDWTFVLEDLTITGGNATEGSGGHGGGADLRCPSEFHNVAIVGNSAFWDGGGVYFGVETSGEFSSCIIEGNHAGRDGGGIYSHDTHFASPIMMSHCLISNNTVQGDGGGLHINSGIRLQNCTIVGNAATNGAGVYIWFSGDSPSVPAFTQCIIYDNQGEGIDCASCVALLACNDVFGNENGDYVGFAMSPEGSSGNFSADPRFCGSSGREFFLKDDSPCAEGMHPDGWACDQIGAYGLDCEGTPVQPTAWSTLKRMY